MLSTNAAPISCSIQEIISPGSFLSVPKSRRGGKGRWKAIQDYDMGVAGGWGWQKEKSNNCTPARKCKLSLLSGDGGGTAVQGAGGKCRLEKTNASHLKIQQAVWPRVSTLRCSSSPCPLPLSLEFLLTHLERHLRCGQHWIHHTDGCIHSTRRE